MLWLPDATVTYLFGKHVLLFIAAVLILLVGLIFTVLLFSWQWLLYLPEWRIFKCIRDQKFQTFIETYHVPYAPKHRYWTGLLLLTRAILYLVTAVNVSHDPVVTLTALIFTASCILVLKSVIGGRVCSKWLVDILNTFFYWNIIFLAVFTWYSLGNRENKQEAVAYISVAIALFALLFIILYHVYAYTGLFSMFKKTNCFKIFERLLTKTRPKPKDHPPPDDDDEAAVHRFSDLLDIFDDTVNTRDCQVPVEQKSAEPTKSVVAVHHPHLERPEPAAMQWSQCTKHTQFASQSSSYSYII